MIYGYARVSTNGQAKDGNSLNAQKEILMANGCEVIYEESYTGSKKHRPKLDILLSNLEIGDVVIVTKLDRIARSVRDGLDIIDEIVNKGCELNILNMGKFDDSASGKLMRTIFLAFSEFEREMIVQRTTEGKAVAKANNPDFKEGRPSISQDVIDKIRDGISYKELGISRATWYNYRRGM